VGWFAEAVAMEVRQPREERCNGDRAAGSGVA
jgi:hypothetical protein